MLNLFFKIYFRILRKNINSNTEDALKSTTERLLPFIQFNNTLSLCHVTPVVLKEEKNKLNFFMINRLHINRHSWELHLRSLVFSEIGIFTIFDRLGKTLKLLFCLVRTVTQREFVEQRRRFWWNVCQIFNFKVNSVQLLPSAGLYTLPGPFLNRKRWWQTSCTPRSYLQLLKVMRPHVWLPLSQIPHQYWQPWPPGPGKPVYHQL